MLAKVGNIRRYYMDFSDRIYGIIEPRKENKLSRIYDVTMLVAIVIGIIPLMFRTQNKLFIWFDISDLEKALLIIKTCIIHPN